MSQSTVLQVLKKRSNLKYLSSLGQPLSPTRCFSFLLFWGTHPLSYLSADWLPHANKRLEKMSESVVWKVTEECWKFTLSVCNCFFSPGNLCSHLASKRGWGCCMLNLWATSWSLQLLAVGCWIQKTLLQSQGQPPIVPTMTILGGGSILFTLVWLSHYQQWEELRTWISFRKSE